MSGLKLDSWVLAMLFWREVPNHFNISMQMKS